MVLVEELLRYRKYIIIFDLASITGLDSTGIGRFIAYYNKIAAAGAEMRMARATGHLIDVFHVSKLDMVFRFYATIEEAAMA
jgi:anti-anti-sigma factor